MATKVYFFGQGNCATYDRHDDLESINPTAVPFPALAAIGFDRPSAALNNTQGKVYFFQDDQYVRYDVATRTVDQGYPAPIAGNWPRMSEVGFADRIDACYNATNGKAYFFHADQYVRYDLGEDHVDDGYPRLIADGWPGMQAAGFAADLDAVIRWGDGKLYFFKGASYLRYDLADDRADAGYPLGISEHWPGLGDGSLGPRLRAATDTIDERDLWIPSAQRMLATKAGPKYLPVPWRGVLHTTEGPTIDGALATFAATNFWPTLTIEPHTFRVVQHYSLGAGARALSDRATPANASRAVQIEIVGFAKDTPNWAPETLAFIRDVVRSIEELVPIPRRSDSTFLNAAGVGSTPSNRMTVDQWKRFSGWCGHQHVPGETHWDPGAIDIAAILS